MEKINVQVNAKGEEVAKMEYMDIDAVEKEQNGLMVKTYPDNASQKSYKEKEDSFMASIFKRLKKVITMDETEEIITTDYIMQKLELTEEITKLKELSEDGMHWGYVNEIDSSIGDEEIGNEAWNSVFGSEKEWNETVERRSGICVDPTKGMIGILPMDSWGIDGGVYAIKVLSDTEKRTTIKLVLKYLKGNAYNRYECSEFIEVK